MTQITLRIASIGDIHNTSNLSTIQTFLTAMKNAGKLDFFVHSGDMSSSSSSASQMASAKTKFAAVGTTYFVACGNHDVSGNDCYSANSSGNDTCKTCNFNSTFGYCHKLTTFAKGGQNFQIVIAGIRWSGSAYWKFDFASASTTLPTIVIVHGPVLRPGNSPGCGAWDSLHEYAFNMKSKLDALNTLAVYSGHVHEASVEPGNTDTTPTNNRLYVVQDSVNSSRCGGANDKHLYIGYTKIVYDTTTGIAKKQYKNLNYTTAFTDPFPDTQTCPNATCTFSIT